MVDWFEAAATERQVLYRACKRLKDQNGWDWNDLREAAQLRTPPFSDSFENNFRAGRISRKTAFALGIWIEREYPALAQAMTREIIAQHETALTDPWEEFLRAHGVFGLMEATQQFQQSELQIQVQQPGEREAEWPTGHLKVMQPFILTLTVPIAGVAIAIQWMRGRWMLLPLWGSLGRLVEPGTVNLPAEKEQSTDYQREGPTLIERSETGLHRIVVMIAPEALARWFVESLDVNSAIPTDTLTQLAERLGASDAEAWRLLRLNLMFYSFL